MRASVYVGRVGGLAVALGIGAAASVGAVGLASASPTDSTASSEEASGVESTRGSSSRPADAPKRRGSKTPTAAQSPEVKPKNDPVPAAAVPEPRSTAPRSVANKDRVVDLPAIAAPTQASDEVVAPVADRNIQESVAVGRADMAMAPTLTPVAAPAMVATPRPAAASGGLASVLAPLLGSGGGLPIQSPAPWVVLAAARRDWEVSKPETPPAASVVAAAATTRVPVISNVAVGAPAVGTGAVSGTVTASASNWWNRLTYKATTSPKGAVTITQRKFFSRGGLFTYTPSLDARHAAAKFGATTDVTTDTVTVTVTDARGSATRAVVVPISPVNAVPTATKTVGTPDEMTGVVVGSVTGTDADRDALTYSAPATTLKGSIALRDSGAFTYTPTAAARHAAARTGAVASETGDSFTVTINDGYGGTVAVPIAVAIGATNNVPTATVSIGAPDPESGLARGAVLATDADNDPLTYSASKPANGNVAVNTDGTFSYSPTSAARTAVRTSGALTDSFTITVSDGYGGSKELNVTAAIAPFNSVPVAGNPMGTADPRTGVVTGSVNAVDPDNDPLTYTAGTISTAKGGMTAVTQAGDITYTPTAAARHAAARTGAPESDLTDTFSVVVTDSYGASTTLPLSVDILAANAAPIAGDTIIGTPDLGTGAVAGKFVVADADEDSLAYSGSTVTSKGEVVVNSDGTFTYKPTSEARRDAAKDLYTVIENVAGVSWSAGVTVSPDGIHVYVSDSSSLKVVDTATNSVTAVIPVRSSERVAFSPDGSTIYATNYSNGTMSVIDAGTNRVTATVSGLNAPSRVTISPDGAKAYVVDEGGALRVVDLKTNTADVLIADLYPSKVAVSKDGTRAYAANSRTETLTVIDLASGGVIATVPGIGKAMDIAVSQDGKRLYLAQRGPGSDGPGPGMATTGALLVMDAASQQIFSTITVTGGVPNSITLSSDGSRAYVTQSQFGFGAMSVIDLASGTVVGRTAGLWSPTSVALTSDGSRAYVSQWNQSAISVVNLATTDIFSVTVTDGYGGTLTIPVTVPVSQLNSAPVIGTPVVGAPDASTGAVSGSVTATDADNDTLAYSGSSNAGKGGISFSSNGDFTYTPTVEARRAAALPGAPNEDRSDTIAVTVTDGYGGLSSVSVAVPVSPAITSYKAGDVKRDPATGRIAIRTTFSENTVQPGTEIPGWLNWLTGGSSSGAGIAFPSDVAGWNDFYLVGTSSAPNPYDGATRLPAESILRNPQNGAVAIRTIFDESGDMAWLILTTSSGGQNSTSARLQGWDILLIR